MASVHRCSCALHAACQPSAGDGVTFTHLDDAGKAHMVDITSKAVTVRTATARATVRLYGELNAKQLMECDLAARAGVKGTSSLIPLCHPIPIDDIDVVFDVDGNTVTIDVTVASTSRTGVEMEALTGATMAAISFVGLAGAPNASIIEIAVWRKSGGRSGDWGRALAAEAGTP